MNLSKSRYTRGVQCPKMMWMDAHMPEQFDDSVMNQAVLASGNEVGDLAMGYFGPYVEIPFDAHDFEGMARLTRELMTSEQRVICEATFEHDGNVCMVDILRVEEDGVHLVEVKSSTHVHDIYLHDMAYQCWLLGQCGYVVKGASLMHVDSGYVRSGELDLLRLFKLVDLTDEVLSMTRLVGKRVDALKELADQKREPGGPSEQARAIAEVQRASLPAKVGNCGAFDENIIGSCLIGPHCSSPYPCGYQAWCWRHVPHPSVLDLGGYGLVKAFRLAREGVVTFDDVIASNMALKSIPRRQVEAYQKGESLLVDASSIARFLAELSLPLYFLDFETYQPAIPPFDDVHPYQQIPTQFSLHVVRAAAADDYVVSDAVRTPAAQVEGACGTESDLSASAEHADACSAECEAASDSRESVVRKPTSESRKSNACVNGASLAVEHYEFLAEAGSDPRRGVAEALVRDIPRGACVVAYNMSFERMVLRDLAKAYPDLADHLLSIRSGMHDLMVPFRSGWCYAAAQGGSFSIKAVLPALFPHDPSLDYHALDGVHNGAQAQAAFADLAAMPPDQAARTREALLRYCELDTLAMVRIWERLCELAS